MAGQRSLSNRSEEGSWQRLKDFDFPRISGNRIGGGALSRLWSGQWHLTLHYGTRGLRGLLNKSQKLRWNCRTLMDLIASGIVLAAFWGKRHRQLRGIS